MLEQKGFSKAQRPAPRAYTECIPSILKSLYAGGAQPNRLPEIAARIAQLRSDDICVKPGPPRLAADVDRDRGPVYRLITVEKRRGYTDGHAMTPDPSRNVSGLPDSVQQSFHFEPLIRKLSNFLDFRNYSH